MIWTDASRINTIHRRTAVFVERIHSIFHRISTTVFVLLIAAFVPGRGNAEVTRPIPSPALLEVITTENLYSHREPYRNRMVKEHRRTAIYMGNEIFLVGGVDPTVETTFVIHDRRFETTPDIKLLAVDTELQLALIRVKSTSPSLAYPFSDKNKRVYGIRSDRRKWDKRQKLSVVSLTDQGDYREQFIFFEGWGTALTPTHHINIPVLIFNGYNANLSSGDPILYDGKLAAIVIDFDKEKNLGYAIPHYFLNEFYQRNRSGKSGSGDFIVIPADGSTQENLSRSIVMSPGIVGVPLRPLSARKKWNVPAGNGGFMLTDVLANSGAARRLYRGDIILTVDGMRVSQNGTIYNRVFGELGVSAWMTVKGSELHKNNSHVKLRVLRDGQNIPVTIYLKPFDLRDYQVPPFDNNPAYYIVGGLVFVELSDAYLEEAGEQAPARLRFLAEHRRYRESFVRDRFVILDRILPTEVSTGYDLHSMLLKSVNGIAVRNLQHTHELVEEARREKKDLIFKLEGNKILVLDFNQIKKSDDNLKISQGIPVLYRNLR